MARVGLIALLALLLAGTTTSAQPTSQGDEAANAQEHQNTAEQSPSKSAEFAAAPTPKVGQPRAGQETDNADNDLDHNWFDWYAAFGPPTWSSWTLAMFAVVAAVIGLRTLSGIREQAEIARTALTKLERPWIIIGLKDAKIYATGRDHPFPYMTSIFLSKRNSGRSLVWIVSGTVRAVIVTAVQPLPETPDYKGGTGISFGEEPVAQSQEVDSPEQRLFVDDVETWIAVHSAKSHLAVYGKLEYRGVLEPDDAPPHETRFRLFLMPPIYGDPEKGKPITVGAYYAGPAAYNRCT